MLYLNTNQCFNENMKIVRMNGWMIFLEICWAVSVIWPLPADGLCGQDAGRLIEDLLADYNKLVRPVENDSDTLIVRLKLKLSQLLDVVCDLTICFPLVFVG